METKRCQRCHKLLRIDAQVCSRCGGHDFTQVAATRSRQTVRLTSRPEESSLPSNPPASSHRAGHYSGLHPEDQPYQSSFLPVLPASTPYAILQEPEEASLAMLEDVGEFLPTGNRLHPSSAQPGEDAGFAMSPEPELFDPPAENRRIATFTPLPPPSQQRSPQVLPTLSTQPLKPITPIPDAEDYQAGPLMPLAGEPLPITLRPARRGRVHQGGIIPILLVLSCFLFLVATSILAFLLFGNRPTPALAPVLYAEPATLGIGDILIVSGSRFPANAMLRFTRDSGTPVTDQSGKPLLVPAYSTGNFSAQITITPDWSLGSHTIFVSDQQNDTASVTVSIVGTPPTPPHLQLPLNRMDMGADASGKVTHRPLTLTNAGGQHVHWQVSSDSNWLSANPEKGAFSKGEDVEITVNRGTLAANTYSGHLKFTEQDSQPPLVLTLTVTMAVNPASPTATASNLVLSSAALTFNGTATQNPAPQSLTLQNTGGQPLNWTATATTTGGGNWLAVSPASGSLPAGGQGPITVGAASTGLIAGTYAGALTLTYGNTSTSVTVTLVVSQPPVPVLALQTGEITFNAIQGQNPFPKTFTISNPGNAPLDWGISEDANGKAYAPVSATSGTLAAGKSATITVTPSITQLSAATYSAHITVSDTDPGTTVKSQQITVTFVIVNQAVINLNENQMSFAHTSDIQVSSQLLIVTDTGSATLNWGLTMSNSSPVQWLAVDNTGSSLTPGTTDFVNVTCDSTHLSPGTYSATLTVYDTEKGTPVPGQSITVTLVVS